MTLVGPGQAPPEWGCDAIWEGGDPVLEKCTAVFGVMYRLGTPTTEPGYLETAIKEAPLTAGGKKPLSAGQLNLDNVLPSDRSYYTYIGSLVRSHDMLFVCGLCDDATYRWIWFLDALRNLACQTTGNHWR